VCTAARATGISTCEQEQRTFHLLQTGHQHNTFGTDRAHNITFGAEQQGMSTKRVHLTAGAAAAETITERRATKYQPNSGEP